MAGGPRVRTHYIFTELYLSAVVFHHPLPVSKFFIRYMIAVYKDSSHFYLYFNFTINQGHYQVYHIFLYIISVISFEITPDRFGISFLKGSRHLHIYYLVYISQTAVTASTYQMKTYLNFIFYYPNMSKNSFKSFGIFISI